MNTIFNRVLDTNNHGAGKYVCFPPNCYFHHAVRNSVSAFADGLKHLWTGAFGTESDVLASRFSHRLGGASGCVIQTSNFIQSGMCPPRNNVVQVFDTAKSYSKIVVGKSVKLNAISRNVFMQFTHNVFGRTNAPLTLALRTPETIFAPEWTAPAGNGCGFWRYILIIPRDCRTIVSLAAPSGCP